MDFGETGANVLVILAIVALLVFNIFLKRRRGEKTPVEMAVSLLTEINRNQMLAEAFRFELNVSKFKTGSWKRNKDKLDFLDHWLRTAIDESFSMAESFNQEIAAAKKSKSTSYLSGINVAKLKESLSKSKQGLEEWLQVNMQSQPLSRRRGCLSG